MTREHGPTGHGSDLEPLTVAVGRLLRPLRAVTASMQPPRLLLGLLLIASIMAWGRTWDGLRGPRLHPGGLLAPVPGFEEEAAAQADLRAALEALVPQGRRPEGWAVRRLEPQEARALAEEAYAGQRHDLAMADATAEGGRQAAETMLHRRYLAALVAIERIRPLGAFEATVQVAVGTARRCVKGALSLRPDAVAAALRDGVLIAPGRLWRSDKPFVIVCGGFALLATGLLGGALSRMAAVQEATGQRMRAGEGLVFAAALWPRLVAAPLVPPVIALVLLALPFLLGLLLAVPVLDLLGGLLYGIGLGAALLAAVLLLATLLGLPLFLPAVACENADPAEAAQRALAYLLQRPVHVLTMIAVSLVGLAVGYVVVAGVASLGLLLAAGAAGAWSEIAAGSTVSPNPFELSIDRPPAALGGTASIAAGLVGFWETLVIGLVAGWVVSYLCSSATILYLSARELVDGQDRRDIWQPGRVGGTTVPTAPAPRRPWAFGARTLAGLLRRG